MNKYFNVKSSLENKINQLRNCKQRTTNVSPFEAQFGREINTLFSLLSPLPSNTNMSWNNVKKHCLDFARRIFEFYKLLQAKPNQYF